MKITRAILQVSLFAACAVLLFPSCSILSPLAGGYGATGVPAGGAAMVKGQFRVDLIECVGNTSAQDVTVVVAVTNIGPNASAYIGGSSDGTLGIDSFGATSKPYGSAGTYYELPSNVTVRAEIKRINPVRPGAALFQTLRVSIGSGRNNIADFRNVPIAWVN